MQQHYCDMATTALCACDVLMVCPGGKHAHDIYKYLSLALDKSVQHSRYDMPRSALQLLAKHACQWDQCIIDDYEAIVTIHVELGTFVT